MARISFMHIFFAGISAMKQHYEDLRASNIAAGVYDKKLRGKKIQRIYKQDFFLLFSCSSFFFFKFMGNGEVARNLCILQREREKKKGFLFLILYYYAEGQNDQLKKGSLFCLFWSKTKTVMEIESTLISKKKKLSKKSRGLNFGGQVCVCFV